MLHHPSGAIVPWWTGYAMVGDGLLVEFRTFRQHWAFLFRHFGALIFVPQDPHRGFWALFQVP